MTTLEEVVKSFTDSEYGDLCTAITDLYYAKSKEYSHEKDPEKQYEHLTSAVRLTKFIQQMDEVRS